MYFNQRIKKVRANQGMTQEQFGKLFGVSKATVYNWEHMMNYPDDKNLKKLAEMKSRDLSGMAERLSV